MLPTNLSSETIMSGLYMQELQEQIAASNLANPYLDSNGYLMNSIEVINTADSDPYTIGSPNGNLTVGSGVDVQSITRLRDMFLDGQIQTESSVVGYNEVLNSYLGQINTVINPNPTTGVGSLNYALTQFANDWATLASNPQSIADRSAVVQDGVTFANLANNQYTQLQNYQEQLNGDIGQTVNQINDILQQLAAINKNLLASSSANVNPLLDARDYALDQLSRLINIQVNFGTDGTVAVNMSDSGLALVNEAGASIFQTNLLNGQNPDLSAISLQSSEGSEWGEVSQLITGGTLGGELYTENTTLENYKNQIDQIATSVLNVTNVFNEAGYAADGTTTGTPFFTGTGAADINVNATIVSDPTHALVAAALLQGTPTDGTMAQYLGNLPNLLANNFIESIPQINIIGGAPINPATTLLSQATLFKSTPAVTGGTFTVNGSPVAWNNGETIDQILQAINAADPNVYAVFNTTDQQFYMFSSIPIAIENETGNFTQWGAINNVLTSSIRMNNSFALDNYDTVINYGNGLNPVNAGLNSTATSAVPLPKGAGNLQAFAVTPGMGGTFTLNGVPINWFNNGQNNPSGPPNPPDLYSPLPPPPSTAPYITGETNQSLFDIVQYINNANTAGAWGAVKIGAEFNNNAYNLPTAPGTAAQTYDSFDNNNPQTLTLFSSTPVPISIVDNVGNFTAFTGLNANATVGNLSSGILTQISSDLTNQGQVYSQASASLTQLNNEQANIGAVGMPASGSAAATPGVPVATIEQESIQAMIAYNANLQVLQVIDQMYSDLLGIVSGEPSNSFFTQSSSSST